MNPHDTTPRPTDRNAATQQTAEPEQFITSRLTTDGTRYLPETYESSDGTRELPHPMMDPQTGARRKLLSDWELGDPRRDDPAHQGPGHPGQPGPAVGHPAAAAHVLTTADYPAAKPR